MGGTSCNNTVTHWNPSIHLDFCEEHSKRKCCICAKQAIVECDHAGQFVCGAPLCGPCGPEHYRICHTPKPKPVLEIPTDAQLKDWEQLAKQCNSKGCLTLKQITLSLIGVVRELKNAKRL